MVGKWSRSDLLDAASGRTIRFLDHPREVQAAGVFECGWKAGGHIQQQSGLIHVRDAQTG